MQQDKFTRTMLTAIVVLLALNLVFTAGGRIVALFESRADAQIVKGTGNSAKQYDVKPVRGYEISGLKEIVVLGDGKSFVVSNDKGFMVYQFDTFQ